MRLTRKRVKTIPVPNDLDNGSVIIRVLRLNEIDSIDERASNITLGETDSGVNLQPVKRADLIAKACIEGWDLFFDENGKKIKYSKQRVPLLAQFEVQLDDREIRFFEWVDEEHDKFSKEVREEEKAATKN